jgi:dolichol-phosphate mannosyltransferase
MNGIPREHVAAVIPAYNEAKTVSDIVKGASRYAKEVIVVDDGSSDGTAGLAISAGATVIRIPNNCGKGKALAIGLTTAALNGSKVVVCLDADGQHDPDDIPRVIEPVLEGRAEMVIGSRFLDASSKNLIPVYRRAGQHMLTFATNIGSPVRITDSQSGYRAFRKEVLETFHYCESGMGVESEMVRAAVRKGLRIEEVPIKARYDGLDTSTLNPTNHGMRVLTSILRTVRYEHPLLYFGVGGLAMTIAGVLFGLYSVQQYIEGGSLPFGPSLLAVMATTVGIILMTVGLILSAIGEMIDTNRGARSQ